MNAAPTEYTLIGHPGSAADAFPLALWVNDTCGNEDPGKSSSKRKEVPSPGGLEYLDRRTRRRNEDWTSTPQESWSVCAGVGSNAMTLDWERWGAGDGLSPRRSSFDFGVSIGGVEAEGGAEDEFAGLEGILAAVCWEKRREETDLALFCTVERGKKGIQRRNPRRGSQPCMK